MNEENDKDCQGALTKAQLYRWRKSHLCIMMDLEETDFGFS